MPDSLVEKKKEDQKPIKLNIQWSNEDETARSLVYERFQKMKEGRTGGEINWEDYWDESDKGYNAHTKTLDEDDTRSNLHIPIEFAISQAILREMVEIPSIFETEPVEQGDAVKSQLMNAIIRFSLKKGKYTFIKYLLDHSRVGRGTSIAKVVYRQEKRKISELSKPNPDKPDEEVYKEKEIYDFDDAYIKFIDNWFFFPDEMTRTMEDARDCIEREVIHIDEFKRLYKKYENAQYVTSGGDTSFPQEYEPPKDLTANDVEVLHYFCKSPDKYIIVANNVPVRNAPNPYNHKQLPYAALYGYKDPNYFWGKSVPYQIKFLVDEQNSLRNLRIDYQKMGLNKMFIVSDQLDVEEEDLTLRMGGMISVSTMNMPLQNYIQPIEYGDVKPSSAKDIDYINEDIRRTTGIDDRIQGVNIGGTATEAAILKEVSMKSIKMMVILAEQDGLTRIGDLFVKTIQQYYPITKVKKITGGNGEETKEYRSIRMEGMKLVPNQEGEVQLEPTEGYSFFQASPEYIRANFDITIQATSFPYVSKVMQQAKITEMTATILKNPVWARFLADRKSLERYLRVHDENPKDWIKEQMPEGDEEMLAEQENQRMIQGEPIPSTQNISEKHTLIHMNFAQSAEWQQAVSQNPQLEDMLRQHIEGEETQHQGGAVRPTKGKPMMTARRGITSPKTIFPAKVTGEEKIGGI